MSDANANTKRDTPPSLGSVLGAGLGFILIVGPLLAFIFYISESHAEPTMSLGALEIILALSSTLAGLIIVTQALGLAQPTSALGLPKGSVRALLAFSLVIIFVAVASWNLGGFLNTQATQSSSIKLLTVPTKDEGQALKAIADGGFNAFVSGRDPGKLDGPDDDTTTISYFVVADAEAQKRAMDMAKDIMTVVATVLVTIVGFYFGSSSTVDGVNSAQATMRSVRSALDGTTPGATGGNFAAADLTRAADATRAIADEMKPRFDALDAELVLVKEAVAKDPTLQPRLEEAQSAHQAMKAASRAAKVCADDAAAIASGITADADQDTLNEAGARVTQFQDDAKKAKDTFDPEMQKFIAARDAALRQTASG